ncbi:MAG: SRPBCC family protein [Caulobacteraceae bacterium]
MSRQPTPFAKLCRRAGRIRAEFVRYLDHPVEEVWEALTDPAQLARWLAPGVIDPRPGGGARLDFGDSGIVIDSAVTHFEPPRRLGYSWSSLGEPLRPIEWELSPTDEGCLLKFGVEVPEVEDVGRACAGWEAHLEMLAAFLEGVPIRFPLDLFKAARDSYRVRLER